MAEEKLTAVTHSNWAGFSAAEIRSALQTILASKEFRASRRCQDFLRYVVETTLHGDAQNLKERTIGIEAFGRSHDYEPSDDASVRVKAGEVRRRLERYYATEGHADRLRLELPAGSYVPEFHCAPSPGPVSVAAVTPTRPKWQTQSKLWGSVLAAGLILAGLAWYLRQRDASGPNTRAQRVLTEFWGPLLRDPKPILLTSAYVPVYAPQSPVLDTAAPGQPMILLTDQFVGGGDLLASARIASLLTRLRHPYQIRLGNQVSFLDLRAAPAVLIGYSYTRWHGLTHALPYSIQTRKQPFSITDNGNPTGWALTRLQDNRHTPEDYALISRVYDPTTHANLIEVAGITQYGTAAGSRLICHARLLTSALRDAPDKWYQDNLQLILHVRVIRGIPAQAHVVAQHFWAR